MRKINLVIVTCIIAYLLSLLVNENLVLEYFAFSGDNLFKGEFWTIITSLFLHANLLHLLGNMLFLYVFGNTLEEDLGATKTLSAFFLGGALSFLLSLFFYDPATPMIGASAAIFTLSAVVMLLKPLKFSILLFMPQGLVAILYFVYNALAVYFGTEGNVAYMAHIIGFAIGIPLGMAWSKGWFKNLLITIGLLAIYAAIVFILLPIIISIIT